MAVRTIDFLPEIFRTPSNQKFLNATLEQATSDVDLVRINGFVGRKFTPTYKTTDNYLLESTDNRTNYQLEPSAVSRTNGDVDFLCSYNDLINSLGFYGARTDNHDRLFGAEFYNFDGHIDYDKFVNFSQYYWLPAGPDAVNIQTTNIDVEATFVVRRDDRGGFYTFSGNGDTQNPTIYLARGGSYTFINFSRESEFWIQSEPGTSGLRANQPNISSREILGVSNNGAESAPLTFNVPQSTAQNFFLSMNKVLDIDLATDIRFSDINGKLVSEVVSQYGGIDGQKNLENKLIIFTNQDQTDWVVDNVVPSLEQKYGVWRLTLVGPGEDKTISLVPIAPIPLSNKVAVREGSVNGNREFYKATNGYLERVPVITAIQDTLYYQDSANPLIVGEIRLIDPQILFQIDVEKDILGRKSYRSPNGVEFTNGLKIFFDSNVTPSYYQNTEFYVEGVGRAIKLVKVSDLATPEGYTTTQGVPFDMGLFDEGGFEADADNPTIPDYITIKRSSRDLNPWSRSNRWFHIDVIRATARYNNFIPSIDQTKRGQRPIIEFTNDLQLFNFGRIAKSPVNLVDTTTTDILSDIEGQSYYEVDGIPLIKGMRVLFTADEDPETNNRIYDVEQIDPDGNGSLQIHLVLASDSEPVEYDTVIAKQGFDNQGKQYWFNGNSWVLGQQKTSVNQPPLFDVFDDTGASFSDPSTYPGTTFAGTKIISYKQGTGKNDPVLGFPLSYRTIASVGDILLENNFSIDTFGTSLDTSLRVNQGFLHVNQGRFDFDLANTWKKIDYPSQQFQVYSYDYNNSQRYPYPAFESDDVERKTLKVYAGSQLLDESQYTILVVDSQQVIEISESVDLTDKKITILVYTESVLDGTFYQVPVNLDNNALNAPFETATLGQLRNHFKTLYENSLGTVGEFPGNNNVRDLDLTANQGTILQHSSGLPYAMLFMTDNLCNFMSSIDHSRREYTTFKNKFLEIAFREPGIESLTADQAVDQILAKINDVKTSSWPWYYSDMVPAGELYVETTNIVALGDSRSYPINTAVEMNAPSSTSVLVFLNGEQLLRGIDYEISNDSNFVTINDSVALNNGDRLVIREYSSTDGSWVPETPTKLGLYPKFTPAIIADNTYVESVTFIRGHDGSMTPAFGDQRDEILLELEKRIFNNIKVVYSQERIGLHDVVPGQYRLTEYSRDEINQILGREFARWAGNNRVEYSSHYFFDSNDAFTWNYKKFKSAVDEQQLLGHWRAIFNYMYDTEHPDTRPWEMLGFSQEPTWWQERYGPAPYTSGNLVLWEDLEAGRIAQGPRAGVDARYARPGLLSYIPVDEYGQIKSPNQFLIRNFNGRYTEGQFAIGDHSPAETAWRKSSEFPFSVQVLLALTKPARYFGLCFDTYRYSKNTSIDQFLFRETNQRPTNLDYKINGVEVDGQVQRSSGYLNWVSEYVKSLNIDPATTLKAKIDNLGIQLSYKMAGFSDKKYLKAFAEQNSPQSTSDSVLIPDDDYQLVLRKSVPLERLSYSAVVVERTVNGYRVEGYDSDVPFFNIVPSRVDGNGVPVEVLGTRAMVYPNFQPIVEVVPYGTEFATEQQVFDFLIGYGRYLTSRGFVFEARIDELNETKNWTMAGKEFLTWSQHRWTAGNIIVLSPVFDSIDIVLDDSIVDRVSQEYKGSKILDQNFGPIREKDMSINRIDNTFNLTTLNQTTIGLAVFNTVQYEHVFLPNNTTVFNDVIYQPELGNRQGRIRLVGFKTGSWAGNVAPPGFVLNQDNVSEWRINSDYLKGTIVRYKDKYFTAIKPVPASTTFDYQNWTQIDYNKIKKGLLPNFTNKSANIERYYDTENVNLESEVDTFSKGVIGYRNRDYFSDLGLDDTSQIKFYQGYIKQKGTKNAITALTRAKLNNLNSDIRYYEEWAFRTGEYGAVDLNQMIEIRLDDSKISNNSTQFKLLSSTESAPQDIASFAPSEIYRKPNNYDGSPFITRSYDTDLNRDINRAGYARLDDVDITLFDITQVPDVDIRLSAVGTGKKIWTAKDFNGSWNIYRVSETNVNVVSLANATNGAMRVKTDEANGVSINDLVIIKDFDDSYDGLYRVTKVLNNNEFLVQSTEERLSSLVNPVTGAPGSVNGLGKIFKLVSVRYTYPSQAAATNFENRWKDGEKIWIDQYDPSGSWAVLEKTSPWNNTGKFIDSAPLTNGLFGTSSYITADGSYVLVGAPGQGSTGEVVVHEKDGQTLTPVETLVSADVDMEHFGTKITGAALDGNLAEEYIAVGSPLADSSEGRVTIYKKAGSVFAEHQTLTPALPSDEFGTSLAMSQDARWLYVGSPGNNTVYAYGWDVAAEEYVLVDSVTGSDSTTGDRFGQSVFTSSDGTQLIVGAPFHDDGAAQDTGKVYVFDRSVEAFEANGDDTVFTTFDDLATVTKVIVDNVIQEEGVDYNITSTDEITFAQEPTIGSIVKIDTNVFRQQQALLASTLGVGSNFGKSIVLCSTDCSLYIGNPNYDTQFTNSGSVTRFVNQTRVYGTITGTVSNPTVTAGHGITINNFVVVFTGTTLADVVDDINEAGIPGVSATTSAGRLVVKSDSNIELDRLRIGPYNGTVLDDLGLSIFAQAQVITHPSERTDENFGEVLALSTDARTLYVGVPNASMRRFVSFDQSETTFDVDSTVFSDLQRQSGAVYIFEYLDDPRQSIQTPGQFDFVQELEVSQLVDDMTKFDQFGSSLATRGDYLVVGAIGDDEEEMQGGAVYGFSSSGQKAWNLLRQKAPQIETDAINRVFLYSIDKSQILTYLDIFDPAKGKIIGQVAQDIDYISSYDPASYNNTTTEPSYWAKEYVGRYWWDTDAVRYIDYEQGDYVYRSNYWGRTFPGSQIIIYEWVESTVLPSQYVDNGGQGTPRYPNDSRYVVTSRVDEETGVVSFVYYFWVGNRDVAETSKHSFTTGQLARIIADPRSQNISYAAIMDRNLIGLYNINEFISGTDTVLAVDFDLKINQQVIHSEFQLVQEGNPDSILPARIVNRLIDSLSGQNAYGNIVPQPNLPVSVRYGIKMRPRQTVFVDRVGALRTLVSYVNRVFAVNKITENYSLAGFMKKSAIPAAAEAGYSETVDSYVELTYINISVLPEEYRILVISDEQNTSGGWAVYEKTGSAWVRVLFQETDTTKYWTYRDWYASDYNPSLRPTYTVSDRNGIAALALLPGDTIRVNNRGNGLFEVLRAIDSSTTEVVGLENGTVEILPTLYTDTDNAIEIRNILEALKDDILVGELAIESNNVFFLLIRYVLIEQKNIDWAFKTSFIGIKHQLRSLEMFPNYQVDNQTYLESYIEEVKPYRTKIREYLLNYTKLETFEGNITDFDLPAYYDTVYGKYRSPSGEDPKDINLWQNDPKFQDWYANYQYSVIEILVEDGGSGYTSAPSVSISGGNGSGATAISRIAAGRVVAIIVTNIGEGYTSTPTVTITSGNGSGARAYAVLGNDLVRSILTTIKFDRVSYGTSIKTWQPDTLYYRGELVRYQDTVYRVTDTVITGSVFDLTNLGILSPLSLDNWDLTTSYAFGDIIQYQGELYRATADFTSGPTFDRVNLLVHTTLPSSVTWAPFTFYAADTVVEYDGLSYLVLVNFTSGNLFSQIGFQKLFDTANDRTMAFYQPKSGMPGLELEQTFSGIEYPGVRIKGLYNTTETNDEFYDTIIQSYFTDLDLGTRPEDIDVDGGAFVDTFSSHGPEELVPGRMFDSFDIQVYSVDPGDLDNNGAGPEIGFASFSGDGSTAQFLYSEREFGDNLFVYTRLRGPQRKDIDFTQDFVNKTITFNIPPVGTDRIYIYVFDSAGTGEISRISLLGDGSTVDFTVPVTFDLISDSLVFVDGVEETGYDLIEGEYGQTTLRFNAAPVAGTFIDVHVFNSSENAETYSQVYTQTTQVTGNIYPVNYTIDLDRPVFNDGPLSANIIVEVDGRRLRPANNGYYTGNGTNSVFFLSDTIAIDPLLVSDNDIEVYQNGQRMAQFVDYEIVDGAILGFDGLEFDAGSFDVSGSGITVVFNTPPADGDTVVISCLVGAEFRMNSESQILINPSVALDVGSTVYIHSFSNHDNLRIRTQVFIGSSTTTITTFSGFDEVNFDIGEFDGTFTTSRIVPIYTLSRPVTNLSYLWVTLNGQRLLPNYDFTMIDSNRLKIGDHIVVGLNDVVIVTHFTENTRARATAFRIRQNIRGEVEYLRISDEETTLLAQDLELTDTEIHVQDAARLATPDPDAGVPGVVIINKERITYYTIDRENNVLGQIRRGTGGTGAAETHEAGSRVVDASYTQRIPTTHKMVEVPDELVVEALAIQDDTVWYDLVAGGPTVETTQSGLQFANSVQARFIREKYAYYLG